MSLFLAPVSQFRERLIRRRLPVVPHASTFAGDKLAEITALHAAGHHVAAVCVARGAVERRVASFLAGRPDVRGKKLQWMGLQQLAAVMYHADGVSDDLARLVQKFGNHCNKASHGRTATVPLAERVVAEAREIFEMTEGGSL